MEVLPGGERLVLHHVTRASHSPSHTRAVLPGLVLAVAVSLAAHLAAQSETVLLGRPWVDTIVLAILIGMAVRSGPTLGARWQPGIDFAAKPVLELAIVLLGASVNLGLVAAGGLRLLLGIGVTVMVALTIGTLIGRAAGLEPKHASLVAFGNAICGNSAIAALAPIIGARREQVASAIAFTAVLGVAVVLGLPFLIPLLHLSDYQYGVVAGLTVYAVPQVLAATLPVSAMSGDVGTLVKLTRVLFLGPLLLAFSLMQGGTGRARLSPAALTAALPWFIVGFLALATLRSLGLLGEPLTGPLRAGSHGLTVLAMAGLGLGVDVRTLRGVGHAVTLTVLSSLAVLVSLSLLVARWVGHTS